MKHIERHRTQRTGWLRAAVLGTNDGIVSTASLVLGVTAAGADAHSVLIAGVAGLVAGSMSMAAGEYISVSSQADTERSDLARESKELIAHSATPTIINTMTTFTSGIQYPFSNDFFDLRIG